MLYCSLKTLDKLDKVKEKERKGKEESKRIEHKKL